MSEITTDGLAEEDEKDEYEQVEVEVESQLEIEIVNSSVLQVKDDSQHVHQQWESKLTYLLTLVGYAVGFGNIWRFPYQMRENGGFVFLIPYCVILGTVGIPVYFLELAVGQRRRKGMVHAWAEISPSLGGIGVACVWLCAIVGMYYNTLIAYCVSYLVDSFQYPLPWSDCETASGGNKVHLKECLVQLDGRSTKYYWFRKTLDISQDYAHANEYSWWLCLYHLVTWGSVYAILFQGAKSIETVVYVTAVFPYLVLFIFFMGNCVIEPHKGWHGAYRLLKPDWSKLYHPITWLKAGSQLFFSLSLAQGCLVNFASYCPARNNCYKDAIIVSLVNCGTSIFAAFVVFPIIGLLGHNMYEKCVRKMATLFTNSTILSSLNHDEHYDIYFFTNATSWHEVDEFSNNITIRYGFGELSPEEKEQYTRANYENDHWEEIGQQGLNHAVLPKDTPPLKFLKDCSIGQEATASGAGTGFVFQGFTEAVKHMPGANFWSVLFFVMLLTLGIDSVFGTVEGVIVSIEDLTHVKRSVATGAVCGVMTIIAILIFPFGWGIYILTFLDQWSANWTLLVVALLECIAVSWSYGLAKMSYDVLLMTGEKPNAYMLICWKYLSPLLIAFMLVGSIGEFIFSQMSGVMYTAFDPTHPNSTHGDVELPMPNFILGIGLLISLFCLLWVPLYYFLKNTRWKLLKPQAPSEFPEEDLRVERQIDSNKQEKDLFSKVEALIVGDQSIQDLQNYRDTAVQSLLRLDSIIEQSSSAVGSNLAVPSGVPKKAEL